MENRARRSGLRSSRNLGLGDYTDLGAAAAGLASHGAAFLGINPVHAPEAGDAISPYSPGHRAFLNPAHIAVDALPELAASDEARRILSPAACRIEQLRRGDLVDHHAVARIREPVLRALFETFSAQAPESRRAAFDGFVAEGGAALRDFALAETIAERFGADRRNWPEALRDPDGPEATALADRSAQTLRRHAWLQWLARDQLDAAQAQARAAGAALGLYLDLAVGPQLGGSEVWTGRGVHASGVSLGSPPDAFSPDGQTWGLAPYAPEALSRARYAPFVAVLRAVMRHAGIVRIDHALGLRRTFWAPGDGTPGGYVASREDPLLALVAIEAHRAGCLVVGEDLGLVPSGLRAKLDAAGLYGCAVMQFERDRNGVFRDPKDYRRRSLASFGTHDTPTLRGYLAGRDVEWAAQLGRIPPDSVSRARADRTLAAAQLSALCGLDVDEASDPALTMHRRLASAGSELAAVQLGDAHGALDQQNLPGTIDEHPNWRRRHGVVVEDLPRDGALAAIGREMADAGRDASPMRGTQENRT